MISLEHILQLNYFSIRLLAHFKVMEATPNVKCQMSNCSSTINVILGVILDKCLDSNIDKVSIIISHTVSQINEAKIDESNW